MEEIPEMETMEDPIESYEAIVMVVDVTRVYEQKVARVQERLKWFTREGMHRRFGRKLMDRINTIHELEDRWLSANADLYLRNVPANKRASLEAHLNAARDNYRDFFHAAMELVQSEPASVERVNRVEQQAVKG